MTKFRRAFKERLKLATHRYGGINVAMIRFLDSLVHGWGNYYGRVNSKKAFAKIDNYIWWETDVSIL